MPICATSYRVVGAHLDSNNRTARLLFRKTEKSIDMKNSLITKLQTELQHFRHQSNRITKQRRKKVVPDPNKKFVSIAEVIRTKRTMRAISVDSSESDDSDDTDNMSDCIVVGGRVASCLYDTEDTGWGAGGGGALVGGLT